MWLRHLFTPFLKHLLVTEFQLLLRKRTVGLVPPTLELADVAPYLRLTKLGRLDEKDTLCRLLGRERPKVTWFTVRLL